MNSTGRTKGFFTYKGYPLVRKNDTIYFGNMYDEYVIMLSIMEKKKIGNLEVASRIKIYQMSTDENLNPIQRVVKSSEKNGLYEALDLAKVWLERSVNSNN